MEQDKTKPRSWKKILLVVIFGYMLIGTTIRSFKQKPQQATPNPSPSIPVIQERKGKFLDYEYSILYEVEKERYTITYDPFLRQNDAILIGAILSAIGEIYGKHLVTNLTPQLVERNGVNILMFAGTKVDYYCMPIKEDTGEVHTLAIWSE